MKGYKSLLIGSLLVLGGSIAQADTYAVCMGVNVYPKHEKDGQVVSNDLKGAVNDATSMKDVLVKKFHVSEGNVRLVTDADANEDGFINNIKWLLQSAKPGDQVVFCYSGHGARLDDPSTESGKEQVIVLSDEKLVPGKLFGTIARRFANNGVNASFVFDSCFSGGMSRPGGFTGGSFTTKSMGDLPAEMKASLSKTDEIKIESKDADVKGQYAFLYAGKEDQPTIDLSLRDKPAHGLFTMLLLSVIEDNSKIAVKDLFSSLNAVLEEVNKQLAAKSGDAPHFEQKPSFETSTPERSEKPVVIE